MTRMSWLRSWAVLGVLAIAAAACGDGAPVAPGTPTATETPRAAGDGVLKVGTLLPQTGDLASLGPPMTEGIKLAVKQINDAGGVLGKPVELVEGDSGTNEQVASSQADELLRENVDAIIGAASSRISLSVIDKITGSQTVQCSPANTSPRFTTYEDNDPGYYVRTAPPDKLQGPALADMIVGDGFSNVGIIALNDAYGQGLAQFLSEGLEQAGATVAANVAYDPAGAEFSADVQKLADANPDAVALIGFPDTGSKILREMIAKGIGPGDIAVYGADGMQDDTLGEAVNPQNPAVIQGFKGTAPSSEGSQEFLRAFRQSAPPGTQQIFSAHAYDCMNLIAMAAEQAGSDDPTTFREEIVDLTKDGETCTDYTSCKELIDQDSDVDYQGASGELNFTPPGEPGQGTYELWEFRVQAGEGMIETLRTVTVGGEEPGASPSPTGASPSPTG